MQINGINGTQGVAATARVGLANRNKAVETKTNVARRDEMEINAQRAGEARELRAANADAGEIRFDLVNRIRAEIAAGTYYTDEKFEIALGRMFDTFE